MKKIRLYILLLISLQACQEAQNQTKISETEKEITLKEVELNLQEEEQTNFDIETHLANYKKLKSSIIRQKRVIKNKPNLEQEAKLKLAENYISNILVDSIFPYWLGTEWDFNGYTETPRQGVVACGYFVSTTLRDLGIKLNRYRIAQKGAADIIHALCDTKSIVRLTSIEQVSDFMKDVNENEILIVGLDFHVGFLFKRDKKAYFAHSNYIEMAGVEIELMEDSQAFSHSDVYVVGNLTKNRAMTENWLN